MAPLLHLEEPPRPTPNGFALFALGFRPFYLLASVFAALSVPLWALQFSGWLDRPYLSGPVWHAHEMLFGFTLAVIVGFLYTAGRNWTNLPTPTGWTLGALAALWVAARVLVVTPHAVAAAVANIAFPLAAALGLAVPFIRAKNTRNYFFVGLLGLLTVAAAFIHLSQLGVLAVPAWLGIQVALDVVLFTLAVMGGRVIPMFTNNGVPGTQASRHPWVEKAALGALLVLLAADILGLHGLPTLAIAAVACIAHAWRWLLWQPWKTLRVPLVWVLHVAYAWIPLHLALRALAAAGWIGPSAAIHALTIGAIGGLVIGMITRTARGHTGRPLVASRIDVISYALVLLAALVRVGVTLVAPAWTLQAIVVSAACWSAGFALYTVHYWRLLTRPRLDGKPG